MNQEILIYVIPLVIVLILSIYFTVRSLVLLRVIKNKYKDIIEVDNEVKKRQRDSQRLKDNLEKQEKEMEQARWEEEKKVGDLRGRLSHHRTNRSPHHLREPAISVKQVPTRGGYRLEAIVVHEVTEEEYQRVLGVTTLLYQIVRCTG